MGLFFCSIIPFFSYNTEIQVTIKMLFLTGIYIFLVFDYTSFDNHMQSYRTITIIKILKIAINQKLHCVPTLVPGKQLPVVSFYSTM